MKVQAIVGAKEEVKPKDDEVKEQAEELDAEEQNTAE
jgi:hypothetical protein